LLSLQPQTQPRLSKQFICRYDTMRSPFLHSHKMRKEASAWPFSEFWFWLQALAPFAIGTTVFLCHLVALPIDGCRSGLSFGSDPQALFPLSIENTRILLPLVTKWTWISGVANKLWIMLNKSSCTCSVNPARSFGTAAVSHSWADHWIFWVGPFGGAIIASLGYDMFLRKYPTPTVGY
jgi:hypothetical protein